MNRKYYVILMSTLLMIKSTYSNPRYTRNSENKVKAEQKPESKQYISATPIKPPIKLDMSHRVYIKNSSSPEKSFRRRCSHSRDILFSYADYLKNIQDNWEGSGSNFIKLPLLGKPFDKYNLLVAVAPPHFKLSGKNEPTVVYIIVSNDSEIGLPAQIPKVYFVRKESDPFINRFRDKAESYPVIIVDSNRTRTGLKSKEIAKALRFKNKFTN